MLELYHGTTSVWAQKTRLTLAKTGLEWKSHRMALNGEQIDPAYLKLNPNSVVPTLVHDGIVFVEYTVMMHYLDDTFALPPLESTERTTMPITERRLIPQQLEYRILRSDGSKRGHG